MKKIKKYKNNFIRKIIEEDLFSGRYTSINTRFPPEPNGHLHIGHAKSVFLNFEIAKDYKGKCNLRFDDTNPIKEDIKYINSIKNDIKWLGFKLNNNIHYTSEYFDKFYNYALELINKGLAYIDQLSINEIRKYRGTLNKIGKNSPYRDRNIYTNKNLFIRMSKGEFPEGSMCLRAKIDMSSPYIIMRDPILYRIKFIHHHQTGNKWCIYPMYDFAHCISDALEGITHSLCTLEFQNNKKLYNWILKNITINNFPKQYEFSRLNIAYTILSKRKLNLLISKKIVDGFDDPRMPTISGLRRRGYTASSIRKFCNSVGVTKQESNIEISLLESCIRSELNQIAPRIMAVIKPILLIIETLPLGYEKYIKVLNHPNKPEMGTHFIKFSREIFIEYEDFQEISNDKYKRLTLNQEVRLRYVCTIKAKRIEKNTKGEIIKIFCHHDYFKLNKKTKSIIHWVSVTNCISTEFRIYNKLFNVINPSVIKNFISKINNNSLIISQGFLDKSILSFNFNKHFQFERLGYFFSENRYSNKSQLIFNRIITLKDRSNITH